MKPKHVFWFAALAFTSIAVKLGLAGEQDMALLVVACAVASVANAMRPDANKVVSWADVKKLFSTN